MKCPVDDTTLAITDRQGIEIDYCPECRGVWLDRGELDKLIEREGQWVDQQVDERSRPRGKEAKAEPPMKKKKGERTRSRSVTCAVGRSYARCAKPWRSAAAARLSATGTSHGTPATTPIASSAEWPGGYWEYQRPAATIMCWVTKNSGRAGAGAATSPAAKIRA